ncbi:PREDICTED: uncharacterized protein LOC105449577 [Wasmannia auropunctata]|uniref:uncharacterized protein LOC105449577 n=1 Tax=Wasmannia auropunctata TaxID=64793 RepID=UPI0005EDB1AE|nr:PREDICTED: uncharacterized protein LOC105449577 [Wasmannia auropunctata]XP_011687151.1 PREDICTED: uncharacterized protein LOC105449577 [Wasmannia auropunctata]
MWVPLCDYVLLITRETAYINGVKHIYDVLLVNSNRCILYRGNKLYVERCQSFLATIFYLMMTKTTRFMWLLLAAAVIAQAKPLNLSIDESINEIDSDNTKLQTKSSGLRKQQRNSALPTDEASIKETSQTDAADSAAGTAIDTTIQSYKENSTIRPGSPLSWFLTPFVQKVQFSPQSFLQDRLQLLKETLNNLGINVLQNVTAKQLTSVPGGLVHFLSPTDSGFYTNRLEPAGFLGGNGWFANKGGILGGPGAIVSTGSLLTDYPTPYRRK